jgi:hypothetical protein
MAWQNAWWPSAKTPAHPRLLAPSIPKGSALGIFVYSATFLFHFPRSAFSSTLSPVQPAKLETLSDLLAQAEHYAEFCMRGTGKMSPTLFLIGADGPLMFVPTSLVDADEKDDFADTARLVCIAHAATACVMTLEAWIKIATPGEEMDMTEPPSEAFDRQEVIVLMGESRDGQKQKFLPIIRHDNGKFFNLGETTVPGMHKMTGRFAQILPTKIPDKEMRSLAQTMLQVIGVKVSNPVETVRLPRSRRFI